SALRPPSPHGHRALAVALDNKALHNTKAFPEAIAEYSRVIELTPEDPRAWYERGDFYGRTLGPEGKAMGDYAEAVEVDPNYAQAHRDLAQLLMRKGQVHKALAEYVELIRLRNDYGSNIRNPLKMLKDKGKLKDLIATYRKNIHLKPEDVTANIVLGIALELDAQPGDAMNEFREALRLSKNDAWIHGELCSALRNAGVLDDG